MDFFDKTEKLMTPLTWLAGDWNCVPDVTLDVDNANPLNYANGGADALAKKMEDLGLIDERREQLEGKKEFTRKGVNIRGEVVSTRLDRWYVLCPAREKRTTCSPSRYRTISSRSIRFRCPFRFGSVLLCVPIANLRPERINLPPPPAALPVCRINNIGFS